MTRTIPKRIAESKGVCSSYAKEPDYNGEFWAEFVGWKESTFTKAFIYCYFDTHIAEERYIKLKALRKENSKGELIGYFPVNSKTDFSSVPLNTNWHCKFRRELVNENDRITCKWLTAEQFNLNK